MIDLYNFKLFYLDKINNLIFRLKFKNEDEQNGKIEQITELLAAKSKEKCGGKWEFNGEIHFRPLEAKKFFNNILNLARDVEENKNSENDFLQIIKRNKWYSEFLDSADVKIEGEKQNIQMFMTKFRGIIYDFKWELIWSFKKRSSIYVHNAEGSANKICDLLLFRLLLEFLNSMTKNENFLKFFYSSTEIDYLETKKGENIKLAYILIKLFNEYNKKPEEFYNLELNEKYSENTKKMITRKVEEFIENYIDGELNVVVDRLKRN
ncbi:unnamed protein product [Meloidogyne enterolobii]|uniref:Uncharacterized protein n=1 Tax=Meloidogyne enterolobii TaxID=390850 RepID=A0ACB1AQM6_MELEN